MSEQQMEKAPPNSLPSWSECALRVSNADFIARRVAEGGSGPDGYSLLATQLHRLIYEYDDADPYRSAWFLHRLELVLDEAKSDLAQYKEDAEKWRAYVEQKWISVKDSLPETGKEVLVYRPKFYMRPKLVTGHLIRSNDELCWNNDCEDSYFDLSDVTHWMPLFKFPEDKK